MDIKKLEKQFDEIMENITPEDFKTWLLKKECCEFLEWCNEPISRNPNSYAWRKRVAAQAPDYNSFTILDNNCNKLKTEKGEVWFTSEEVYEQYLKSKQDSGNNQP